MIELFVRLHVWCLTTVAPAPLPLPDRRRGIEVPVRHARSDRGQATTEYALVMLGAAAVALLVITWATAGGGAGRIGRLFDKVIDAVVSRI
jgi:hypothetical protein